jgi:hypothetical protein
VLTSESARAAFVAGLSPDDAAVDETTMTKETASLTGTAVDLLILVAGAELVPATFGLSARCGFADVIVDAAGTLDSRYTTTRDGSNRVTTTRTCRAP